MQGNWIEEFGADYAVPEEILRLCDSTLFPAQLRDRSWSNDAMPQFEIVAADGGVCLCVEHPDPAQRESGGRRYWVDLYDEENDYLGTAIETDSLAEILFYLADHWDIVA